MKRVIILSLFIAVIFISLFAKMGDTETFTWTNPTTYVDGTAISTAKQAQIKTHLAYGSSSTGPFTEFAVSAVGAATYTGPVPVDVGVATYYTLQSELDGIKSAYMTPAVSYTKAPIACNSGSNLTIKP